MVGVGIGYLVCGGRRKAAHVDEFATDLMAEFSGT